VLRDALVGDDRPLLMSSEVYSRDGWVVWGAPVLLVLGCSEAASTIMPSESSIASRPVDGSCRLSESWCIVLKPQGPLLPGLGTPSVGLSPPSQRF
jgi:hypothetical protein